MGTVKIRYCICCKTNKVKNLRKKDCIYCKNCGRYLTEYHNAVYYRAMKVFKKKIERYVMLVDYIKSILRSKRTNKIVKLKEVIKKYG